MAGNERLDKSMTWEEKGQLPVPSAAEDRDTVMWCTVKEYRRISRFPVTGKTIIRWLKEGTLPCEFRRNKGKRGNLVYEILLTDDNDREKLQRLREAKLRRQEDSVRKKGRRQIKINMKYDVIEALLSNKEAKSQLMNFIVRTNLAITNRRKRRLKAWVPVAAYDKLASAAKDSKKTISEVFNAYVEQLMSMTSEWELVKMAVRKPAPPMNERVPELEVSSD